MESMLKIMGGIQQYAQKGKFPFQNILSILLKYATNDSQTKNLIDTLFALSEEKQSDCNYESRRHFFEEVPNTALKGNYYIDENLYESKVEDCFSLEMAIHKTLDTEFKISTEYLSLVFCNLYNSKITEENSGVDISKNYLMVVSITNYSDGPALLKPEHFEIKIGEVQKEENNNYAYIHQEEIYQYSFKEDDSWKLYVEVKRNNEVICTIDYNEFIESLKNKQYEKLATCTFTTFQPENKKVK